MRAYPIRGQVLNNIMILKGLPTSSTQVLTKDLIFQNIQDIQYENSLVVNVAYADAGYAFNLSNDDKIYIKYNEDTLSFEYADTAYPVNLITSSITKELGRLYAGMVYDLFDIKIRFLPSMLYEGATLNIKRNQEILNIEKNITLSSPPIYYFTSLIEAKDNIIYKYSYNGECKTGSKGLCGIDEYYTPTFDYDGYGACYYSSDGFKCFIKDTEGETKKNNIPIFILVFVIFFLCLGFVVIALLYAEYKSSPEFRKDLYFKKNYYIDVSDWH